MPGYLIGWAHTRFGELEGETLESLVSRVAVDALEHAGVESQDVDEIVVGHFNQGMSAQGFPSSLPLQADSGLRFKPSTRVENACATGSAAIRHGQTLIDAGAARAVLVIGAEVMTQNDAETVRKALVSASYVEKEGGEHASFAGLFAQIAQTYFQCYGDQSHALAEIASKNHRNGSKNPLTHMQKDVGYSFCATVSDKNPYVAPPLRRTDCSMVSDGAAALLLVNEDFARSRANSPAVRLRAMAHVNDFLPMASRNMTRFEGASHAWSRALETANLTLDDLDFVETHDCFTIAELIEYEAMGLTPAGQGSRAIAEGWTHPDGRLPVNLSGGLRQKGIRLARPAYQCM